ncbi:MAG: YceI family protein [Deltaproteobacteria bacterium]|nr:YceI family protein [Deltaproteobacteria bacterium]
MPTSSRKIAASLPALAAALTTVRWWIQGSGNLYTDTSHGSYQPDPDLGWRFVEEGPLWLGLDAVGVLVGLSVAVFVVGWWIDRRASTGGPWGPVLWGVGVLSLGLPIAAFATGLPPDDARDQLPEQQVQAPTEGVAASLPGLAAGRYAVAEDPAQGVIVATVSAGGEEFQSRFTGLRGTWTGDPSDLGTPMEAIVEADPRTVDTGVELRSKHAHEYLQVEAFDVMRLQLSSLSATEAAADGAVTFAGPGTLTFIGDELDVDVTGTLRALDQAARRRLGLATAHAIKVTAGFFVPIAQTKLSAHASDFSADRIPIQVELILIYETTSNPSE